MQYADIILCAYTNLYVFELNLHLYFFLTSLWSTGTIGQDFLDCRQTIGWESVTSNVSLCGVKRALYHDEHVLCMTWRTWSGLWIPERYEWVSLVWPIFGMKRLYFLSCMSYWRRQNISSLLVMFSFSAILPLSVYFQFNSYLSTEGSERRRDNTASFALDHLQYCQECLSG